MQMLEVKAFRAFCPKGQNLGTVADRVSLETVVPPVFGKESWFLNIRLTCCVLLVVLFLILSIAVGCIPTRDDITQPKLKVASTTSLCDSGLWEWLEPLFEAKYRTDLQVLCVGTGVAMRYGERGDVDAIVVHDPEREEKFISQGYGAVRMPFACNKFLIVGPEDDPARIRGLKPEEAFARLAAYGDATFVSRGDESGTHVREKEIWRMVGINHEQITKEQWYVEVGSGMGLTLQLAAERRGYTLTDRATFLTFRKKLDIVPLVEEGEIMLNVYSIIVVNPEKCPGVNYQAAKLLSDFLLSKEVQAVLTDYGVQAYGERLFLPCCDCN